MNILKRIWKSLKDEFSLTMPEDQAKLDLFDPRCKYVPLDWRPHIKEIHDELNSLKERIEQLEQTQKGRKND